MRPRARHRPAAPVCRPAAAPRNHRPAARLEAQTALTSAQTLCTLYCTTSKWSRLPWGSKIWHCKRWESICAQKDVEDYNPEDALLLEHPPVSGTWRKEQEQQRTKSQLLDEKPKSFEETKVLRSSACGKGACSFREDWIRSRPKVRRKILIHLRKIVKKNRTKDTNTSSSSSLATGGGRPRRSQSRTGHREASAGSAYSSGGKPTWKGFGPRRPIQFQSLLYNAFVRSPMTSRLSAGARPAQRESMTLAIGNGPGLHAAAKEHRDSGRGLQLVSGGEVGASPEQCRNSRSTCKLLSRAKAGSRVVAKASRRARATTRRRGAKERRKTQSRTSSEAPEGTVQTGELGKDGLLEKDNCNCNTEKGSLCKNSRWISPIVHLGLPPRGPIPVSPSIPKKGSPRFRLR